MEIIQRKYGKLSMFLLKKQGGMMEIFLFVEKNFFCKICVIIIRCNFINEEIKLTWGNFFLVARIFPGGCPFINDALQQQRLNMKFLVRRGVVTLKDILLGKGSIIKYLVCNTLRKYITKNKDG